MKMKVKKSQRPTIATTATSSSSLLNKSMCSQLCFCVAYILLAICLLESFHVDAYINGAAINMTNSFQHFNIHRGAAMNVSRRSGSSDRIGRFLFDSFFGIDTPPLDATDFDDDDDEEDVPVKPCKCGKSKIKTMNQMNCCSTKCALIACIV